MPSPRFSLAGLLSIAAVALFFGASNSFLQRVLLASDCPAACGTPAGTFDKPVFLTFVAFVAMASCALYTGTLALVRCCRHWRRAAAHGRGRAFLGAACGGGASYPDGSGGGGGINSARGDAGGESGSRALSLLYPEAEAPFLADDSASVVSATSAASVMRKRSYPRSGAPCCCAAGSCCAAMCGQLWLYNLLWLPSLLDAVSTALAAVSMLFVSAATCATMRGTLLLFTLVANRIMRTRDGAAGRREVGGVLVAMLGVGAVGAAELLAQALPDPGAPPPPSAAPPSPLSPLGNALLGLGLALASNLVMALQIAWETARLEARTFSAGEVNAVEGAQGALLLAAALGVFQLVGRGGDGGHVEDSAATLCCLASSSLLLGLVGALFAAFALSTTAHMLLSAHRGANFRSLILVARALIVWLFEFAAFYLPARLGMADAADTAARYGLPWQRWAWLQAAGFFILAVGAGIAWRGQSARELAAALERAERRRRRTSGGGGGDAAAFSGAPRASIAVPPGAKDDILVWRSDGADDDEEEEEEEEVVEAAAARGGRRGASWLQARNLPAAPAAASAAHLDSAW